MKYCINIIVFMLLINTYLFSNSTLLKLTKEEKNYLKKHNIIKAQNESNWPPYNFRENGKAKGFSIDYMNLLAKKLNVQVEYVSNKSWKEFMEMLENNDLDVIINISKNKIRNKKFNFTSVFHTAANAIYVHEGNEHIDSLEKLEGKTIVMPKGFFAQQLIEKYYPNIKQIYAKDSLETLKLLSLGKAVATIGKKNVLDYIISTKNISGVVATNYVNDNRLISLVRMATNKNNKILNSILEKAQKAISDEELLMLKRKWFGINDINKHKNILTSKEKFYLQNKLRVKMCNIPNLKPIEFFEDNKFKGISIDTLKIVEKKINKKITSVKVNNITQAIDYLEKGLCDIIPSISKSNDLIDIANFTKPMLSYKLAIITQKGNPIVQSLKEVINKPMAKASSSELIKILKSNYPNINILETNSDYETLEAVNSNKVYFAIEPLPIASYYMSKFALNNIFISRYTNMFYNTNIAVNNKDKILLNILNKALDSISEEEQTIIFNKWTNIPIKEAFDYSVLWKYLSIILIILIILAYRQSILNKHNQKLKLANNKIEEKTQELAKQKELFEKLYIKSADGVLLITNNIIINCNEASLKILDIEKKNLLHKKLSDISPITQPDNELSTTKIKSKIKEAIEKGICSFEWLHKTSKNKNSWIEIVLTFIEIDNKPVIHTVIRDINKRKDMEKDLEVLNTQLENRIKEEIAKNEEKTTQLIQQSRLAKMGEMISMIAHQWRQPLTAISATTNNLLLKQVLNGKIDDSDLQYELELINDYSSHLSSTIDDFRNFFKKDKKKEICLLEDLINKSLNIIKTSFESKNIYLNTNYKYNKKINLYATEIQQVILNILKNAEDVLIEKKDLNKYIFIKTYEENNQAIIEINDNGGGIDKNIIDKIFDPYFTTKKSKEGSGLGLYMSKTIINEHCNGNLIVANSKEGAVFKIYLPQMENENE